MASHNKMKSTTAAPSRNTFAETLLKISYRFSVSKVFDDFLTVAIAACTQNIKTHKSIMKMNTWTRLHTIKIQTCDMNFQRHLHN
jgi:hypothetical protein